jgi:hypothetical protein
MQGDDDGCYGNGGGGVRDYVRVGNYDVVGGYGSPAQGSDGASLHALATQSSFHSGLTMAR